MTLAHLLVISTTLASWLLAIPPRKTAETWLPFTNWPGKPWADRHGSSFAVSKYQLIHFTRRTSSNIDHPLLLSSGQQVIPLPSGVYLGIIFDVKLKWNAQLALIKTKVQKSIGALASLGGSTWGASLQVIRKILHRSCHFPDDIRTVNLVHTMGRSTT